MRSMMPKDSSSTRQAVGVVLLSLFIPVVGVALFSRLWKPTSPSSLSSSEYSLDYFTPTPTPLFLLLSCVLILALLTLLNTNPGTISPPNSLSSQDPDSLSYPTHNNSQEEEEEEEEEEQQQQGEEGKEEELEQDQAELLLVEKTIDSENSFESSSTTKDQFEEEELELVNSREAIATYREGSIDSSIGSSIESSIESSVKEDQEEVVHMERVLVDSENSFESIKEEPEEEDKITKIVASVDGQISRIESCSQEEREIDYRFKEVKESKEAAGQLVVVDLMPRERPYQHHRSLSADIIKVDPLCEFGGGGHHLQYSVAALNSSNKNNPRSLARPPSRFGLHGHGAAAAHHGHHHHHHLQVHRHRAALGVAPRSMKGSILLSSSATSGSSTSGPNSSGAPNSSLVGSSSSSVSVSTEAANKSMEAIWKEIMQSSSRSPAAASISFRHARNLHSKLAKKSSATSSTLSRHTSSLSTASSSSSTTSQNLIDKNDNCATSSSSQTPTPTVQTNTQQHVAIAPSPCKPKPRRKVPMSSRREISMTNEELNRRVESFITEFRHQIHIQREQSLLKTQNIKP